MHHIAASATTATWQECHTCPFPAPVPNSCQLYAPSICPTRTPTLCPVQPLPDAATLLGSSQRCCKVRAAVGGTAAATAATADTAVAAATDAAAGCRACGEDRGAARHVAGSQESLVDELQGGRLKALREGTHKTGRW
eukprot:63747-Pelagomonas_calceolata.AAC.1